MGWLRARFGDSFSNGNLYFLGDSGGNSNVDDLLFGDGRGDRLLFGDCDSLDHFHLLGDRGSDGDFLLYGDRREHINLFGDGDGFWRRAFGGFGWWRRRFLRGFGRWRRFLRGLASSGEGLAVGDSVPVGENDAENKCDEENETHGGLTIVGLVIE